ncbi:hypothetical protein DMA11_18080 [Marinilabiliaceae bacterium JC017]|nr:hypothetical protein DMA11_18080 [Marinilabiliaceae bacterium JC017]
MNKNKLSAFAVLAITLLGLSIAIFNYKDWSWEVNAKSYISLGLAGLFWFLDRRRVRKQK